MNQTMYVIDEFGIGLALIVAYFFWGRRREVEPHRATEFA